MLFLALLVWEMLADLFAWAATARSAAGARRVMVVCGLIGVIGLVTFVALGRQVVLVERVVLTAGMVIAFLACWAYASKHRQPVR